MCGCLCVWVGKSVCMASIEIMKLIYLCAFLDCGIIFSKKKRFHCSLCNSLRAHLFVLSCEKKLRLVVIKWCLNNVSHFNTYEMVWISLNCSDIFKGDLTAVVQDLSSMKKEVMMAYKAISLIMRWEYSLRVL